MVRTTDSEEVAKGGAGVEEEMMTSVLDVEHLGGDVHQAVVSVRLKLGPHA